MIYPNVKCSYAGNARTGVELIRSSRPDVVLIDLNMPMVDGLECLRKIKRDAALKDIPIFIYTTNNKGEMCDLALEEGAIECVKKPNSFEVMRETVCKILIASETQALRFRQRQGKGKVL